MMDHVKRWALIGVLAGVLAGVPASAAWGQAVSSPAARQEFVFAYRLLQRGELEQAAAVFEQFVGRRGTRASGQLLGHVVDFDQGFLAIERVFARQGIHRFLQFLEHYVGVA